MKLTYLNRKGSIIKFNNEPVNIHLNILIADHIKYCSMLADNIITYKEIDSCSDDKLFEVYTQMFDKNEKVSDFIKTIKEHYPEYKKTINLKNKDKDDLVYIGRHKSLFDRMRKQLKLSLDKELDKSNIKTVLPFLDQGVFEIHLSEELMDNDKEDFFVREIINTLIDRDSILVLDWMFEPMFRPSLFNLIFNRKRAFVTFPLLEVPPFRNMTYNEMRYTKEELKITLAPLKKDLLEFTDKLSTMRFEKKNVKKINKLLVDTLWNHLSLQQKIDESLYITKLKNQFPPELNSAFCIGITSAESIVDYFEKAKIILPYLANEIKQQLSRHIELKSSHLFFYQRFFLDRKIPTMPVSVKDF